MQVNKVSSVASLLTSQLVLFHQEAFGRQGSTLLVSNDEKSRRKPQSLSNGHPISFATTGFLQHTAMLPSFQHQSRLSSSE